jgi:hypothetical protein
MGVQWPALWALPGELVGTGNRLLGEGGGVRGAGTYVSVRSVAGPHRCFDMRISESFEVEERVVSSPVGIMVMLRLQQPATKSDLASAFSVWTQYTVQTGKRSELPRGMPLVTRVFASSEHAWDPMASSSVNFCRKKRTVPLNAQDRDAQYQPPTDSQDHRTPSLHNLRHLWW